MNATVVLPRRALPVGLVLGAVVGMIVLGFGGRIAMRIIGQMQGQPPGFSFGGSMTVVFLGAMAGLAGGFLLWLGRRVFPSLPIARGLLFWIGMSLLTLRVLNPVDAQRLIVFGPVLLLYGATLYPVWCRRYVRNWSLRSS
jgi:hypothetical protein